MIIHIVEICLTEKEILEATDHHTKHNLDAGQKTIQVYLHIRRLGSILKISSPVTSKLFDLQNCRHQLCAAFEYLRFLTMKDVVHV